MPRAHIGAWVCHLDKVSRLNRVNCKEVQSGRFAAKRLALPTGQLKVQRLEGEV